MTPKNSIQFLLNPKVEKKRLPWMLVRVWWSGRPLSCVSSPPYGAPMPCTAGSSRIGHGRRRTYARRCTNGGLGRGFKKHKTCFVGL